MSNYLKISATEIPKIIDSFESVMRSLKNIEKYACEDFRSTKRILDVLIDLGIERILSDPTKERLSEIISDLQYVDMLQQRLAHVGQTTKFLKDELVRFSKHKGQHAFAYQPLNKLNLTQFQDSIDLYLNTTDMVQNGLNEISINHRMLFLHIPEIKLLYRKNIEILGETTNVRNNYKSVILKYEHPEKPSLADCVQQVKDTSRLYSMEQERKVLNTFLKTEMEYKDGFQIDSDEEQISIF